jgi:hypothetical protein
MNAQLRTLLAALALAAAALLRAQTVAFVVLQEDRIDAFHRRMIEALHVRVQKPHDWGCSFDMLQLRPRTARQRGLPQRRLVRMVEVEKHSC